MNILHIIPSYKPAYIYGGPVESIANLCEALVHAGEDVTVYTTTANGKNELDVTPGKEYNIEGVKVIYFKRQSKDPLHFSVSLLKNLYKHCREFNAVHIHSWWNVPAIMGAFICKIRGVKVVFSPRGMLSEYIISHSNSNIKQFAHKVFGASLLKYMAVHATAAAEMEECKRIIPGWRGMIIPNINRLPAINISKKQNDRFTIIFLSRIHHKKGLELLFEAVSDIKTPVRLQIAGTGDESYIASLKGKAKALGIENKIQWLGWKGREEKFETLVQADLFALTSYNENFANVVIEALHAGTPVLVSDAIGLSEFVEKNNLGWITKPEPDAIKEQLEAAIADKEKREQVSHVAPLIVRENFSREILIPLYKELYSGNHN